MHAMTPLQSNPGGWEPPLLALIGMGMARSDLSASAEDWIARAEILAGGARHLELFPEHPGGKILLQPSLEAFLDSVVIESANRRTAVLASGDPFFFGIGRRLVKAVGRERIVALPNITSVQALFARLSEPWEDVKAVSLHGRGDPAGGAAWIRELRDHSRLALFTDARNTPERIAGQLLEARIQGVCLVVGEDLGLETESVRRFTLEEAARQTFSPLNLVAVLSNETVDKGAVPALRGPVLGLPEEAFQHEAGLITKMEIRAAALAHLQLAPDLVLWDLGAGSGSVSIEAARLARLKFAAAVEKSARRCEDLKENIRRFHCPEIRIVQGNAAEVLEGLPDPDRVFIGGGGGDLTRILEQVAARLRPGGRVVVTAATLDTLERVRAFWRGRKCELSVVQVQVNRSVPLGETLRFEALNPVFIVSVQVEG